jgi:glycosyltransferase involved in cell wall biosynthesis
MKKILFVFPEYPPTSIGGGGLVYTYLVKNFKEMGYEVTVLRANHQAKKIIGKIKEYKKDGVKFIEFPLMPYFKIDSLRTATPPALCSYAYIYKFFKQNEFHIVSVHGNSLPFIDYVTLVLRFLKKDYFFTSYGRPYSFNFAPFPVPLIFRLYEYVFTRSTFKGAKKITTISSQILDEYPAKLYKKKLYPILITAIDPNLYKEVPNKKEMDIFFNKYGIQRNKYFLSVGRISIGKGFQDGIEAFAEVSKKYDDLKYVIVGADHEYKAQLLNLIKKYNLNSKVIFTGRIEQKYINLLFSNCFSVLITSHREPFGIVGLEGMLFEKPILSTNIGGMSEYLEDGVTCLFHKPKDVKKLTENMLAIIEDENLKNQITKNHQNIVQDFTWIKLCKKYEDFFKL